jgi:hypothetical protein
MCIYENIGKQSLLCKYTSYPERLKGCVGDLSSSVFVALKVYCVFGNISMMIIFCLYLLKSNSLFKQWYNAKNKIIDRN